MKEIANKEDLAQARATASQIRGAGGVPGAIASYFETMGLIKEAYDRCDWRALGYDSWESYAVGEFGPDRLPEISGRYRQKIIDMGRRPRDESTEDLRSVYFIQAAAGGLIKIGVAGDVLSRFGDIQRMCPVPLVILATVPAVGLRGEVELHQRFAFARRHGEWFEPVPELLAYIGENGVPA